MVFIIFFEFRIEDASALAEFQRKALDLSDYLAQHEVLLSETVNPCDEELLEAALQKTKVGKVLCITRRIIMVKAPAWCTEPFFCSISSPDFVRKFSEVSEMSARGYALYNVCPQLSVFLALISFRISSVSAV